MFDKILNHKITYLIAFFIAFILFWVILLSWIIPKKIIIPGSFIILLKIFIWFLWIYLLNYIFSDSKNFFDFISDSRLLFWVALIFLIFTIFNIVIWEKKIAEEFSVKAYYFLVWWVWLEILKNIFLEKNINKKEN